MEAGGPYRDRMTTIKRVGNARRSPLARGRRPESGRVRLAARALFVVMVVLAVASLGAAAPPATTFVLGAGILAWLLLSFEADGSA